jgi:hypothetical protein
MPTLSKSTFMHAAWIASERAMLGGRAPTVALIHKLIANFAVDAGRD